MIRAKDLMIGDWVFTPAAEPVTIKTLPDGEAVYRDYAYIKITPEILEKNGFEVRGRKKYFLVPNDPSLAIKREPIIGAHGNSFFIGHFWEGRKDFRDFIEITYVHELQHALRLCSIKKEIVL